jgi:hypothetical protein
MSRSNKLHTCKQRDRPRPFRSTGCDTNVLSTAQTPCPKKQTGGEEGVIKLKGCANGGMIIVPEGVLLLSYGTSVSSLKFDTHIAERSVKAMFTR